MIYMFIDVVILVSIINIIIIIVDSLPNISRSRVILNNIMITLCHHHS